MKSFIFFSLMFLSSASFGNNMACIYDFETPSNVRIFLGNLASQGSFLRITNDNRPAICPSSVSGEDKYTFYEGKTVTTNGSDKSIDVEYKTYCQPFGGDKVFTYVKIHLKDYKANETTGTINKWYTTSNGISTDMLDNTPLKCSRPQQQ